MKKQMQLKLILLLLGFLVAASAQNSCEEARIIFNGLPRGSVISGEDAFYRWSKLHPAIENLNYSHDCFRFGTYCNLLLKGLKNASKLPSSSEKTMDINEYLWRESAFKVINSACFEPEPYWLPTVKTEGLVCKSQMNQIVSMFTSKSMETSRFESINERVEQFLKDSKCVHQVCPACQKLIELFRYASASTGYDWFYTPSYRQFLSEITASCAIGINDSNNTYCKAVENSTETAERIVTFLKNWTDAEIVTHQAELKELAFKVLASYQIQGQNSSFCQTTIKSISRLLNATYSNETNPFEEWFALLRPNLLLWISSCAVSQPSRPKLPEISYVSSSDQCSVTRNTITKSIQAFADSYTAKSKIVADDTFEGAVKKLVDAKCVSTNASCSLSASFTKGLAIKPATEDPQELRERLFLYAANLLIYTNLCYQASAAPNTSNGSYHNCKSYAHSIRQNIGKSLEDPKEFYSLMTFLRSQKGQVESFVKCMDDSSDLKNPGFCKDLTESIRELYVRLTFSPYMDALKQRASNLLEAFEDIIYECDL